MLQIFKELKKQTAKEQALGDISEFLKSILIEVVSENYRHLMYESVKASKDDLKDYLFNPPLRARERIISGIFATAISRVAPRSYPEARVDRDFEDDGDELEGENPNGSIKPGRVDYLSYYHDRVIACELKSGFVNSDKLHGEPNADYLTAILSKRWHTVVHQAKTAQNYLLKQDKEYNSPVSIALMTVGARRTMSRSKTDAKVEEDFAKNFSHSLCNHLATKDGEHPEFSAVYTFPEEFRRFVRLKRGKTEESSESFMPAIAFVARIVN